MRAYTSHTEKSDVFLSYQHADQAVALALAVDLDNMNRRVFIDVHDETLLPGQADLDKALVTAINCSNAMIVVVSDATQESWWVPWEIGVSTPSGMPKAMYRPRATCPLPEYLEKLEALESSLAVNIWLAVESALR